MFLLATLIVTLHNKVFLPYVYAPLVDAWSYSKDMDPTLNNPSIFVWTTMKKKPPPPPPLPTTKMKMKTISMEKDDVDAKKLA